LAAVIIAAITAEESMAEASATKLGDTCSIFQYDQRMETYLRATGHSSIADLANEPIQLFTGDAEIEKEVEHDSIKYFDKLIKINLSELEPHVVGPHTPDHARSISQMAGSFPCHQRISC
jgi:aconitate hydratase